MCRSALYYQSTKSLRSRFQQKVLTSQCFLRSFGNTFATHVLHQHALLKSVTPPTTDAVELVQHKAVGLYLFVKCPDLIPLHVDHRPGSTLCEDRKCKCKCKGNKSKDTHTQCIKCCKPVQQ